MCFQLTSFTLPSPTSIPHRPLPSRHCLSIGPAILLESRQTLDTLPYASALISSILTRQAAAAAITRRTLACYLSIRLCDGHRQYISRTASLRTYSSSCANFVPFSSPTTMGSPKHRLSMTESEGPDPKRLRVSDDTRQPSSRDSSSRDDASVVETAQGEDSAASALPHLSLPNLHAQSRQSIQRSIALVLRHDGFSSTTPEALESFTQLVETCKSRDRCWLSLRLRACYQRHQSKVC